MFPLTLEEFVIEKQGDFPYASGELSRLLNAIITASKVVNNKVNKAGLINIFGDTGAENIQGENQQKLDVYADKIFLEALKAQKVVCGIASEENENYIVFDNSYNKGKYVVMIDPLDGSSNIDVNVSIGTIFSIFRKITDENQKIKLKDLLQPGYKQVAAGYVIYGSSTMLVFSTGNGVNGFTFNPFIGTFYLSHPEMKIPNDGKIYSINEGLYNEFDDELRKYIQYCKDNSYTARYIGSLVADFHRNLIKGGIYIYPKIHSKPNGKLRLLYECNPMAFLIEQAGGKAINGEKRILDIIPTDIHQRCPLYIGSKNMVDKVKSMLCRN